MMQTGYLFGGWQLARAAEVAQQRLADGADDPFSAQGRHGAFLRRGPAAALRGIQPARSTAPAAYPHGLRVDWL
jgi:hypothetical protein